jgi:hypothetical protein
MTVTIIFTFNKVNSCYLRVLHIHKFKDNQPCLNCVLIEKNIKHCSFREHPERECKKNLSKMKNKIKFVKFLLSTEE